MDFKFLGNANHTNIVDPHTSAYIIEHETLLLINCGNYIHNQIIGFNLLRNINKVKIIITSLEYKNISTLGSFITYLVEERSFQKHQIFIYTGEGVNVTDFLTLQGLGDYHYTHLSIPRKTNLRECNVNVEFFPVRHRLNIKNYGLILTNKKDKIVYLGDTNECPMFIRESLMDGSLNRLYVTVHYSTDKEHFFQVESLMSFFENQYESCRKKIWFIDIDDSFTPAEMFNAKVFGFKIVMPISILKNSHYRIVK